MILVLIPVPVPVPVPAPPTKLLALAILSLKNRPDTIENGFECPDHRFRNSTDILLDVGVETLPHILPGSIIFFFIFSLSLSLLLSTRCSRRPRVYGLSALALILGWSVVEVDLYLEGREGARCVCVVGGEVGGRVRFGVGVGDDRARGAVLNLGWLVSTMIVEMSGERERRDWRGDED
ncbi:hypothetical protein BJY04DRAFT_164856 [Aspergillus karnatakaensis]|uniref:uncharacterized protein n=1 Tax=Aspergillus karnatakaensis TaxID=1810916 RepID=UPI003CCD2383